jgi:hypothetical protein
LRFEVMKLEALVLDERRVPACPVVADEHTPKGSAGAFGHLEHPGDLGEVERLRRENQGPLHGHDP